MDTSLGINSIISYKLLFILVFLTNFISMRNSGSADLPLHYGRVPEWLASRMAILGRAIIESLVLQYGRTEVIRRLSDPLWFQALGCVLGMDWHSSGITTSVVGALKRAINPMSRELGIYVCGGRGKHSRQTPTELLSIADQTGLNGNHLVKCSKLSAKVDNTAIQDGFQLYIHSFILTAEGKWTVIQQGMNGNSGMARRYHWHSDNLDSFVVEPHSAICGNNVGPILNLVDKDATSSHKGILSLTRESPFKMIEEIRKITLPGHHDVRANNVDLKRLGSILALAHECDVREFDSLLLLKGLGPRTLQSLALVSEVIHGTPTRFTDPARFSFAHGGKDGHPFPVPLKVYDETINVMKISVEKAKLGKYDKFKAIQNLTHLSQRIEKNFQPNANFEAVVNNERQNSFHFGGMTVNGPDRKKHTSGTQLALFG